MLAMPLSKVTQPCNNLHSLLVKTGRHSEVAFEELIELTKDRLYGIVWTILQDRKLATAALLETYRTVWQDAPNVDERFTDPRIWLSAVARRSALTLQGVNAETANRMPDLSPDSNILPVVLTSDYIKLHKAMSNMSKGQGATIRLSYLYGITYEQLAKATHHNSASLRSWLREGLSTLREIKRRV